LTVASCPIHAPAYEPQYGKSGQKHEEQESILRESIQRMDIVNVHGEAASFAVDCRYAYF
jgi:hypothetical protein